MGIYKTHSYLIKIEKPYREIVPMIFIYIKKDGKLNCRFFWTRFIKKRKEEKLPFISAQYTKW